MEYGVKMVLLPRLWESRSETAASVPAALRGKQKETEGICAACAARSRNSRME